MKHVVITGGSRGIGAAAVELFAARGYRVTFLYAQNHAAASALAEKTGAKAICCDVSDSAAVKAAFEEIGDLDILVCNAGISYFGLMTQTDEELWDRIFDVNVKGTYLCINASMESFLKKHSGSVITVSSMWLDTVGLYHFGNTLLHIAAGKTLGIISDSLHRSGDQSIVQKYPGSADRKP